MSEPKVETVSAMKIAEVRAFLKAKTALEELEAKYPVAFAALRKLQPVYNATLEAGGAKTKEERVSCGPFELYSFSKKFDGDALYEAVGRQKFTAMGGVLEPVEVKTVNKPLFLALIEQQKVTTELADKVLSYTPAFHKPDPISVPK